MKKSRVLYLHSRMRFDLHHALGWSHASRAGALGPGLVVEEAESETGDR